MSFYQKFIKLCNDAEISPSRAVLNVGISKASVSGWKNGRQKPTDANIAKIAEYFGVSPSYFSEDEEKPSADNGKEPSRKYSDWQILAAYEQADERVKEAIRLLLKLE
jgi:transcriptional regulator with XRE-family HTH domain